MMSTGQIRPRRIGAGVLALLTLLLLISGIGFVPEIGVTPLGYEKRIFDTDRIHSINLLIEDWSDFLQTRDFRRCSLIINEETFSNVGIRVEESALDSARERQSLRLEFDHFDSSLSYHGLDKLELNNLTGDNTMMKDCLTYRLMGELGVAAPLCSYVTVYVNGRSLGLYLAVEVIAESFLKRNFGGNHGRLYQPEAGTGDTPGDVKLQYTGEAPRCYPNLFGNALTPLSEEDQQRLIRSLKQLSTGKKISAAVDIEAVTRYLAVHRFVCSRSGYGDSGTYCLYEKDGRLSLLPWQEHPAFSASAGESACVINSAIVPPADRYQDFPLLSRILTDSNYRWLYQRYLMELLNVDMEAMVEQIQKIISPYVLRDPTRFCSYEEYETAVATLKQFLELRAESVQRQLLGDGAAVDPEGLDLSAMGGIGALP